MASTTQAHVVSKRNLREHHVVDLDTSTLPELPAGSVRVRTALVSLTANNLLYAKLGNSFFKWWATYPVPPGLPSPYNDQETYGIVPAWGYAEILESRIQGLEQGMVLYGFWPTSGVPFDLQLIPAKLEGHFIETSSHRQVLFNLYNRYILIDRLRAPLGKLDQATLEALAWKCVNKTWECGFMLNKYPLGSPPIHPLGRATGGEWTAQDADISEAVVVSLSASGKTARGFSDSLCNERQAGTGPLGLLAITSKPDGDGKRLLPEAPFATKTVGYGDATSVRTVEWIAQLAPKRIVVVDFGGRGRALEDLLEVLKGKFGASVALRVIGVGGEAKVGTEGEGEEMLKRRALIKERVQMNTTLLQDTVYEVDGEENFFRELEAAWQRYVQRGNLNGLKLEVRKGVEGVEEGWQIVCDELLKPDVGMAFLVSS